jgi:ABC-type glutathione transport system ATPase component
MTGKAKTQRAEQLLELVGLKDRMRHHLPELSGGEQQRVAIAVALANNPTLLLADEPTGEVDSATAQTIYNTFRTLTGEMGITTLIVSHDPEVAKQVGRVVAIRDGMLASETIRQQRAPTVESVNGATPASDGAPAAEEPHHEFEELVVVDRAGRLHIPREYLEQFEIKGRAQVEITEEGILIRPTQQDRVEQQIVRKTSVDPTGATQQGSAVRNLLGRFSLKRGKKEN